jgi:hypothetical protein
MGAFGGDCGLEGGGNARPSPPLPLDGSLVVRPKHAQKPLAGSPDMPRFAARVHASPPAPNQ